MSKIVPAAAISLPNSSGFRARARQALPVHRQPDRCPRALGPALEGFSPTPKFPAIAEAKALFEVARPFVSGSNNPPAKPGALRMRAAQSG